MKTKMRMGVTVSVGLVVVTVLLILFMGSGCVILNNESPPNETNITIATKTSLRDRYAYIDLTRVRDEPNDYVELTDEELEQFPALQIALQMLEDSGKNNIWHKTSEQEATAPFSYLEEKYQTQASCETYCIWNTIFKYGDNYYSIHLVIQ